jgi:homoserine dehydrogenase
MANGFDVATANKKPLAGELDGYRRLLETSRAGDRRLRTEATVGAGLPVLDTLEMLTLAGDRLRRIEGCLSGTLSSLMSAVEEGQALSEAVARAVEMGYTEPDPAADLTGGDVARKALILGRTSGLAEESSAVRLTGLVDASYLGLPLAELLERLRWEVDETVGRRVESCRREGQVLRYVARVTPGSIEVGPVAVPLESRLGAVRGPDNVITFHSDGYADRPLVVSGPGAGVDVTARAVLTDVLRIGFERRPSRLRAAP